MNTTLSIHNVTSVTGTTHNIECGSTTFTVMDIVIKDRDGHNTTVTLFLDADAGYSFPVQPQDTTS